MVIIQVLFYMVGVHSLFVWSYVLVSVDYNVSFSLFLKYCFIDIFYDFTSLNGYVFAALPSSSFYIHKAIRRINDIQIPYSVRIQYFVKYATILPVVWDFAFALMQFNPSMQVP